jgi:co-chaperonin GroES (HSP10)
MINQHDSYIQLTEKEFDRLKPINNRVIVEVTEKISNNVRPSGIILVTDPELMTAHDIKSAEKHDETAHLDRSGTVIKCCDHLNNQMPWETSIMIKKGDIVWYRYMEGECCPIIIVDNREYKVIRYDELIVAKRKNGGKHYRGGKVMEEYYDVITLNGYCLFGQINDGLKSKFLELPKLINKGKGVTKFIGEPIKKYKNKTWYDDDVADVLRVGDLVSFRNPQECVLENEMHLTFSDEVLRYEQRRSVYSIIK